MNITELTEEIVRGRGYVVLPALLRPTEARTIRDLILQLAQQERQLDKLVIQGKKERLYGLIYKKNIL